MNPFWRRLRFGLSTLLGVRRLGFFIPYRYAGSVVAQDYPALRPLFEAARPRFSEVLAAIESHAEELRSILGASQERGGFSFHHLLLLENAFDFGELRLRDVMVPVDQVTCLDASKPWPENAAVIAKRATVRRAGSVKGMTIRQKVWRWLAPSSREASSSSLGIDR